MKKSSTPLLLIAAIIILIAAVGIIKFNFLDAPYAGEPVTYSTTSGDIITAHFKTDNSVEVSGPDFEPVLLKRSQSASGERYSNTNGSFVFWSKNNTMFIEQDGDITFRGSLESDSPLAGSIWKYTGLLIDGKKEVPTSDITIILNFGGNTFFGSASCNDFFGSYLISPENSESISFTDLGSTMMSCEDLVMIAEEQFISALATTHTVTYTNQHLSLHYAAGKSLQFKLFGSQ